MDKKQGFFSALREEVARGLSPARARRRSASNAAEVAAALRGCGEALAPLMEGPDPDGGAGGGGGAGEYGARARREGWGSWVRGQLQLARAPADAAAAGGGSAARRNDLRLLLGVMGAPLAPVHVCAAEPLPHLSIKDTPIVSASCCSLLLALLFAPGTGSSCSRLHSACSMKFRSRKKFAHFAVHESGFQFLAAECASF